ncbi:MAG: hypothetical protein ACRD3V_08805 [Vicinamibacteria bacterium]
METIDVEVTLRVTFHEGAPVIESRARWIRERKTLIVRTPILPPGASDEEVAARTQRILIREGSHP